MGAELELANINLLYSLETALPQTIFLGNNLQTANSTLKINNLTVINLGNSIFCPTIVNVTYALVYIKNFSFIDETNSFTNQDSLINLKKSTFFLTYSSIRYLLLIKELFP